MRTKKKQKNIDKYALAVAQHAAVGIPHGRKTSRQLAINDEPFQDKIATVHDIGTRSQQSNNLAHLSVFSSRRERTVIVNARALLHYTRHPNKCVRMPARVAGGPCMASICTVRTGKPPRHATTFFFARAHSFFSSLLKAPKEVCKGACMCTPGVASANVRKCSSNSDGTTLLRSRLRRILPRHTFFFSNPFHTLLVCLALWLARGNGNGSGRMHTHACAT